jgi:hypothetical protein
MLGLIVVVPLGSIAATVADMPRATRISVAVGLSIALAITAVVIAVAERDIGTLDEH